MVRDHVRIFRCGGGSGDVSPVVLPTSGERALKLLVAELLQLGNGEAVYRCPICSGEISERYNALTLTSRVTAPSAGDGTNLEGRVLNARQ